MSESVSAGTKRRRDHDDEGIKAASLEPKRSRLNEDDVTERLISEAKPTDHEEFKPVTLDAKRPRPNDNESTQPRPRKRPGGASRIATADKEAVLQRQHQREEEAIKAAATRGVQDVVRQHYNAVPQRGRDWRKTDSRIKGLRSFNNWVKSTIIHKFSPNDEGAGPPLRVLDIGCGKGGDLGKWQQAPQSVELYVGVDPAEVSIDQARERYMEMSSRGGGGRGGRGGFRGGRQQRRFNAEFFAQDAFGQSIGNIPVVRDVGFNPGSANSRWAAGGFDVVSMMFCMHYAFESEAKTRGMLQNVAGSLKKGGRFIGTIPNSDVLRSKVDAFHKKQAEALQKSEEKTDSKAEADTKPFQNSVTTSAPETKPVKDNEEDDNVAANWGNSIYRVRFPGQTPKDGIFRPPFGWKYNYFMEEAVEVPEYVVPWEAFRALAEEYNLEQQYRKPFLDVWKEEKDHSVFGPLSERMGVRGRDRGELLISDEEMEACGFYHAFCFYRT